MEFEILLLEPAMEFIKSLEPKLQGKVLRTIELLRHFGPQLPMPHSRKLIGFDLWELRTKQSTNICRLFYFHQHKNEYVIVSGYIKKTDKTNNEEIRRAIRLKKAFLTGGRE